MKTWTVCDTGLQYLFRMGASDGPAGTCIVIVAARSLVTEGPGFRNTVSTQTPEGYTRLGD